MSSMQRVAKKAGVSIMTVSRYFNHPDTLSEEARLKVSTAIEALQYVPNAAARSLISGRTDTIALLVSDITNPFFTTITRGIEDVLQEGGYTLFLGNSDETLSKERSYIDVMLARRIDGLILVPAPGNEHHLDLLRHHGVPVVLVDRIFEGATVDSVRGNSREGGRLLTQHLIELGHRDIAFVGGDAETSSLAERLEGYRHAMRDHGLTERVMLGRYDRTSGERIVGDLLSTAPTLPVSAMVAANNQVAAGAIGRLRASGYAVPDDVSLACFDEFELEALADPFLTVVRQPAYEIGKAAARRLLARIHGDDAEPSHAVLDVTLVRRGSTRSVAT